MNAFVDSDRRSPLGELRERCEKVLVECENAGAPGDTLRLLDVCLNDFLQALPAKDPAVNRIAAGLQTLQHAILAESVPLSIHLSDALILTLDRVEEAVQAGVAAQPLPTMMNNLRIGEYLESLALAAKPEQPDWLRQLTELLAPEIRAGEGEHSQTLPRILAIFGEYGLSADPDLLFFATLATPAEARLQRWQGRHVRLLRLGLAMNRNGGTVVDSAQLAAALLLHDVSMAFMPLDVLDGQRNLSLNDERKIHKHADISGRLLENLPNWHEARLMTEQHHEWVNGEGYPNGLKADAIHPGARIIAIADAFEAITHPPRSQQQGKRPYLRAAMEINNQSGAQFCPHWVQVFNGTLRVLRQILE